MSEMIFRYSPMVCQDCKHCWDQQMIQWAPVSVVLAHWKTLRCPACGANWKKIAFVTGQGEPDETA